MFQVDITSMLNDKQCYKILRFMLMTIVTNAVVGIAYLNLIIT